MIVLCAVDHHRFDGGEIPHQSIRVFKENLATVSGRYGDFERRVLEYFLDIGNPVGATIQLAFHQDIHLRNLIRDGLLHMTYRERHIMSGAFEDGIELYSLTTVGRRFVQRWARAELA